MSGQDFSNDTIEDIMLSMQVRAKLVEDFMKSDANYKGPSQETWIKDIRDFASRLDAILKRQEKLDDSVSATFGLQLTQDQKKSAMMIFAHYLKEMDHRIGFTFMIDGWHVRCYWDKDIDSNERRNLLTFKAMDNFYNEFGHYLDMDCYDFSFSMNGLCIDAGEMAEIDLDEVEAELEDL